jgi:hypothetical protein
MTSHTKTIEDKQVYEILREELSRGELLLFAGSGLSAQASTVDGKHPPLWKGLLSGMVNWSLQKGVIDVDESKQIDDLIQKGFLLEAGQELKERLELQMRDCLTESLFFGLAKAGEAHQLVVRIPFRGYLTTNYDEFIEGEFYADRKTSLLKLYEDTIEGLTNYYNSHTPFIVKLHGDINYPNSIVLGNRSYERLLYSDSPYRDSLKVIFSVCSVLFVGFGFGDPDIEALTSMVARFSTRARKHWILLPRDTFPPLKARRLLKDKGLQVIEYSTDDNHSGVVTFLRKLANTITPESRVPQWATTKVTQASTKIESIEITN